MKATYLIPVFLCAVAWADPVSCSFLGEKRGLNKPGCKCATKTFDDKFRTSVTACLDGTVTAEVYEFKLSSGEWYRVKFRMCERLDGTYTYSCKTYNYLEEDIEATAKFETYSTASYRDHVEENLDKGDVKYMMGEPYGKY